MSLLEVRRCIHNPKRMTLVSKARGKRPHYIKALPISSENISCPFCPGNEKSTPAASLVLVKLKNDKYVFKRESVSGEFPNWVARIFPNKYPVLFPKPELNLAYGYHEVLVETRTHDERTYLSSIESIYLALKTLRERIFQIVKDSRIKHITVIKNRGAKAGASVLHPHMQIFANVFVPPEIESEIEGFRKYLAQHSECPLCHQVSSMKQGIFYRNRSFASLVSYAPRVPYETLIVPFRHSENLLRSNDDELWDLSDALSKTFLALNTVLGDFDYNLWFHMTFNGEFYHWHIEILPLTTVWGGYEKSSGVYIVDKFPEEVASELRRTISWISKGNVT